MDFLTYLVIHCTATPAGRDIQKDDIIRWHLSPKSKGGRGWKRLGYSDMIYLDGSLVNLTPYNQDSKVDPWEMTWGARGINAKSRHVVYAGGLELDPELAMMGEDDLEEVPFNDRYVPSDTRTPEQKETLEVYIRYMIKRHPNIKVAGHNQFASKACPSFNVTRWLRSIGIKEKNIYTT
jgi:N-acetylmuramoyl-L-alanine amidase